MIAVNLGTRRLRALERGALITPEEQAELVRLARLGQQLIACREQADAAVCNTAALDISVRQATASPAH